MNTPGTPIAGWLARTTTWWKRPIGAVVALPLVLPPSVLGFYLLLAMGPHGLIGQLTQALGIGPLPFTFWGLVFASVFYSLPFMVPPLQTAFEAVGDRPLEVAATLRASPLDAFFSMVVPWLRKNDAAALHRGSGACITGTTHCWGRGLAGCRTLGAHLQAATRLCVSGGQPVCTAASLNLAIGLALWVQVKSVALME